MLEDVLTGGAVGATWQAARGGGTGVRCPPTCCFSCSQLAALGQDGSEGRTRRAENVDGRAVGVAGGRSGQRAGTRGMAARRLSTSLRFMPDPFYGRSRTDAERGSGGTLNRACMNAIPHNRAPCSCDGFLHVSRTYPRYRRRGRVSTPRQTVGYIPHRWKGWKGGRNESCGVPHHPVTGVGSA